MENTRNGSKSLSKCECKETLFTERSMNHFVGAQIVLYRGFLKSRAVHAVMDQSTSALAALTVLKKICDHPWILSRRSFGMCGDDASRMSLGTLPMNSPSEFDAALDDVKKSLVEPLDSGEDNLDVEKWEEEESNSASVGEKVIEAMHSAKDLNLLLENSTKLSLTLKLLETHREEGHRTLVFSSSRKMLDLIEMALYAQVRNRTAFCRIDGTTPFAFRQDILDSFNDPDSTSFCMLLTTGVGGLGLDATGADRVIIYGASQVSKLIHPPLFLCPAPSPSRCASEHNIGAYRPRCCICSSTILSLLAFHDQQIHRGIPWSMHRLLTVRIGSGRLETSSSIA